MRGLLVTGAAAAVLTAGCGHGPAPLRPRHASAPVFARLSGHQSCLRLLADMARNRGPADLPTLTYVAGHSSAPRMAAHARTAVQDLAHTGVATIALALLRDDCARAGVQIPAG
jgi:hypothetical protein